MLHFNIKGLTFCFVLMLLNGLMLSCERPSASSQIKIPTCLISPDNQAQRQEDIIELFEWRNDLENRVDQLRQGHEPTDKFEPFYLDDLRLAINGVLEGLSKDPQYFAVRDRSQRLQALSTYYVRPDFQGEIKIHIQYLLSRPKFDPNAIKGAGVETLARLFQSHPEAQSMTLVSLFTSESFYTKFGFVDDDSVFLGLKANREDFFTAYDEWKASYRSSSNDGLGSELAMDSNEGQ